jgi:hypothetical protein
MSFLKPTLSKIAASSALLLGTPLLIPTIGAAQTSPDMLVSQSETLTATSAQSEPLFMNTDRVYSYNLEVSRGGTIDGVSIPPGAILQGRYEPANGGLRYDVRSVVINGRTFSLSAQSPVMNAQKDPRDTSGGSVAEDAGIGAAGGALIGEILGDADVGEIVGGAAAGAVVGNVTADRVVVVEPNEPITIFDS